MLKIERVSCVGSFHTRDELDEYMLMLKKYAEIESYSLEPDPYTEGTLIRIVYRPRENFNKIDGIDELNNRILDFIK